MTDPSPAARPFRPLSLLALALVIAGPLAVDADAQMGRRGRGGGNGPARPDAVAKKADEPKSYDDVITDKAVTDIGLINTHRIDEDLFFEIPPATLDTDILWVVQVARTTAGAAYAGSPVQDRVVRFEKRGEKILLRDAQFRMRADTKDAVKIAVEASSIDPIIAVFDIEAYGKNQAPVIKVTDFFRSNHSEANVQRSLGAGSLDRGRTFIEEVRSFPGNVETKVLATYAPGQASATAGRRGGPGGFGGPSRPRGTVTAVVHHSMVKLPDNPMKPRKHDERVGYFSVGFEDYAQMQNHQFERDRYITRWRLEKKDPEAEMSDPVKPIVFYVGRGVPDKLKPFVKRGIEKWATAFEAAGFSNAIRAEYAPDPREDPEWDAEDARHSVIRWVPSATENAFGPHVHDPRTGEILEADVRMYHNVMKLARDWYFAQCAATDERAQKLPMPDDLIGELVEFVVIHEVGHTLGLPHNFKASNSYTVEQLRDPEWTKKNGTAPSIMDYARFNYVAQPGDGAALIPAIGPYDLYSIDWGYRQFPSNADETAELEAIIAKQIDEPMFRFGGGGDYTSQTEDLTDDAIEATRLGLANLERITNLVVEASCAPGKNYDQLANMYDAILSQWNREMGHVAGLVGGVEEINIWYGQADQRYFPLESDRQRAAVAFLVENALQTPTAMMPNDVIDRLTGNGVADRVLSSQSRVVNSLLSARRVDRMSEHADRIGDDAYAPADMMDDLRDGIFAEMNGNDAIEIDVYRRNLQRTYVDRLGGVIEAPSASSDLPALARGELVAIMMMTNEAASSRAEDATVKAHLADLHARCRKALDTENDV